MESSQRPAAVSQDVQHFVTAGIASVAPMLDAEKKITQTLGLNQGDFLKAVPFLLAGFFIPQKLVWGAFLFTASLWSIKSKIVQEKIQTFSWIGAGIAYAAVGKAVKNALVMQFTEDDVKYFVAALINILIAAVWFHVVMQKREEEQKKAEPAVTPVQSAGSSSKS